MTRDQARDAIELRILRGAQAYALASHKGLTARELFGQMCDTDHDRLIKGLSDLPHERTITI